MAAEPSNTVYVTNNPGSLAAAANARVGSVLYGQGMVGPVYPDLFYGTAADAATGLVEISKGLPARLIAELRACYRSERFSRTGYWWVDVPLSDPDLRGRTHAVVMGRYFPRGEARFGKHPLSHRILRMKRQPDPILAEVLSDVLRDMANSGPVELVTRVPPKPSAGRDVLIELVASACAGMETKLGVAPELLRCIRDYDRQRSAGSYEDRRENVRGCFACDAHLTGQHVVLVDDVLTSGSTLAECSLQLLAAGAEHVTCVAFAINQRVVLDDYQPPCPRAGCTGQRLIRFRRSDDGVFWGCSEHPRCQLSLDFDPLLRRWNEGNVLDDEPEEEDIPF